MQILKNKWFIALLNHIFTDILLVSILNCIYSYTDFLLQHLTYIYRQTSSSIPSCIHKQTPCLVSLKQDLVLASIHNHKYIHRQTSCFKTYSRLLASILITIIHVFIDRLLASIPNYSRTSVARTPWGPSKLVRDRGSSSQ